MDNLLPYHRVVLKFGTSLLTAGGSDLDTGFISNLVNQIANLHKQGIEIIIVSSGAVAAGRSRLNMLHDIKISL